MIDYATRYPEAVALPSIETERVAEALVEMFSRVGPEPGFNFWMFTPSILFLLHVCRAGLRAGLYGLYTNLLYHISF